MRRLALIAVLLGAWVSAGALAADSSQPYLGTWTARYSLDQMYDLGLDPRLAGTFRLVLRKNGASRGRFTVSGRRIVFAHDVGCEQAYSAPDKTGAYRWSVEQGKMRLTTVRLGSDPCGGRWQTLTYPVWRKR